MNDPNLKILLIGAGNLAWHLGPALQQAGYQFVQVYSHTLESAKKLGMRMSIPFSDLMEPISQEADMILYFGYSH